MIQKICFVTGSRAEYGLLRNLIYLFMSDSNFIVQVVVTGSHLSNMHGDTILEIRKDGIEINHEILIISNIDSSAEVAKSMGKALIGFADAFEDLNPDLIVVVGDRYEILASCCAALIQGIPIAHLHGGELTLGAIDDAMRHAITKISNLHFVANEEFAQRVIQMGEDPKNVHIVGGFGIDSISSQKLLTKIELETELDIKFQEYLFLVTYHPPTADPASRETEFMELICALENIEGCTIIFTYPNADSQSSKIIEILEAKVKQHMNWHAYKSLGQLKYLSIMNISNAIIGNSSSGILEAPFLKTPTINIGTRQSGRPMADSIINVAGLRVEIESAILRTLKLGWATQELQFNILYGKTGASSKTHSILKNLKFNELNPKKFIDLSDLTTGLQVEKI